MKTLLIQFVNYTLSFVMWMTLGRVLLSLMLGGRANFIIDAFVKITEPVFVLVRRLLPFLRPAWTPAAVIFLILALRLLLVVLFSPAHAPAP